MIVPSLPLIDWVTAPSIAGSGAAGAPRIGSMLAKCAAPYCTTVSGLGYCARLDQIPALLSCAIPAARVQNTVLGPVRLRNAPVVENNKLSRLSV